MREREENLRKPKNICGTVRTEEQIKHICYNLCGTKKTDDMMARFIRILQKEMMVVNGFLVTLVAHMKNSRNMLCRARMHHIRKWNTNDTIECLELFEACYAKRRIVI